MYCVSCEEQERGEGEREREQASERKRARERDTDGQTERETDREREDILCVSREKQIYFVPSKNLYIVKIMFSVKNS